MQFKAHQQRSEILATPFIEAKGMVELFVKRKQEEAELYKAEAAKIKSASGKMRR